MKNWQKKEEGQSQPSILLRISSVPAPKTFRIKQSVRTRIKKNG